MEQEVVELIHCLNLEKELYIEIGILSLLKKKVIVKNDIKELDKIVSEEKKIVEKIADINLETQRIYEKISKRMNIKKEQLCIASIIENIDSTDLKHKLREVTYDFNNILGRQIKLNKINQDTLLKKINHIKSMMNSIMLENENLTYDYEGNDKMNKRQKVNIFDERV